MAAVLSHEERPGGEFARRHFSPFVNKDELWDEFARIVTLLKTKMELEHVSIEEEALLSENN